MQLITEPMGEQALLVRCSDEAAAVRFTQLVREQAPSWLDDVVPAYTTVGIYFNRSKVECESVIDWLQLLEWASISVATSNQSWIVPVCYEMQLDLQRVSTHTSLNIEKIIALHTSVPYTIHAIGFVPGFPYLGYLPEALQGVPRLPSPRVRVEAGSVGLTGKQTGIYPLERPGGWNIIGKTPLTIVDVEAEFFPLNVGDTVRFQCINECEYEHLKGERIQTPI